VAYEDLRTVDFLSSLKGVNDAFAKVHNVWASQNALGKLETKT